MLNIGMDMSEVLLPQLVMKADYDTSKGDNQQINPSSIYSYLNMRGLGAKDVGWVGEITRKFNAIPYLGYWDIYKNYYANKQEERGFVIHSSSMSNKWRVTELEVIVDGAFADYDYDIFNNSENVDTRLQTDSLGNTPLEPRVDMNIKLQWVNTETNEYGTPDTSEYTIQLDGTDTNINDLWEIVEFGYDSNGNPEVRCSNYTGLYNNSTEWEGDQDEIGNTEPVGAGAPVLTEFDLSNIDDMRMDILEAVRQTTAFEIDDTTYAPYGLGLGKQGTTYYKLGSQEGLGIKTYQSDLFNNWISTEWIDGTNGINEVTAVSTAGNEFTIDALNLANKVYNMLNRIAISGGSYDDWLDAVYTHERAKSCENPIYHGSLIKELAFEEVVSNADTEVGGNQQPLGTLAGRGRLTGKHKGGKIKIKIDEPSYIIGLVSITPRVDYSQGNKWDTNLKTMNDLHKPALDEIGFQDLITDQMAWFDTEAYDTGSFGFQSAGKQPAWINYMTNVNQCRGSFAEEDNSMFMTLNRRYEQGTGTNRGITDLTTYVDPSKYNNIFAQESLDSQNFWVQISNDIFARRKMSAKVIPNL
jgi:hypothetical protein